MICTFRHKGLQRFYTTGSKAGIIPSLARKLRQQLDVLDAASVTDDIALPGYDFHPLSGTPRRYSIHVNGPWCLTFRFEDGDAYDLDLENYH